MARVFRQNPKEETTIVAHVRDKVIVSLLLPGAALTLGEPVIVELRIDNGLDESLEFDLGKDRKRNLQLLITREGGKLISASLPNAEGVGRIGRFNLAPGEVFKQQLVLNEWFSPDEPGRYMIDVRLTYPVKISQGRILEPAYSRPAALRLDPRNPARLREVCEELTRRAMDASDVEEAMESVLALSQVRDPLAVPYLERALRGQVGRTQLILGLGRIASPKAVEVLLLTAGAQDEEARSAARWMLHNLANDIRDPSLQARVAKSLDIPNGRSAKWKPASAKDSPS